MTIPGYIATLYIADGYAADQVVRRYASVTITGDYVVEEANARHYTIRRNKVERDSLPPGVADACDQLRGYAFNAVELK